MTATIPLYRRLRSAAKYILTGRWQHLWYREKLRFRGIDIEQVKMPGLGFAPDSPYSAHDITEGPDLRKVLRKLTIPPGSKIIDIGCGKGAAMIAMAEFPFAQIGGCDISPELIRTAEENMRRLGIHNVSLHCEDATTFSRLDDYDFIFLFQPFKRPVFEPMMANVKASLQRRPRDMTIIYHHPRQHEVVVAGDVFTKVAEFRPARFPYTEKS
jgi:SAM-dependent methyltransferase